jgi:hypothetical protein
MVGKSYLIVGHRASNRKCGRLYKRPVGRRENLSEVSPNGGLYRWVVLAGQHLDPFDTALTDQG